MKRSRTLIKTLLVLGPMGAAFLALAPNSSYADVPIESACPPYHYNYHSTCADLYPYDSYDAGDWWPQENWRRRDFPEHDNGVGRGLGHGGFGHGGVGHGGGAHGR
jgi:hypothetical protein